MKLKYLILAILLSVSTVYGQDVVTSTTELENISTIEQTVVHYTKEAMESMKIAIPEAVKFVVDEGTTIVRQYLIYQSIRYGLPVFLGIFLVLYLSRYIRSLFSIERDEAEYYNDSVDEDNSQEFKKKDKYLKFMNRYYSNKTVILVSHLSALVPVYFGCVLVANNILTFIKVTFFSKLYLIETVAKYL